MKSVDYGRTLSMCADQFTTSPDVLKGKKLRDLI